MNVYKKVFVYFIAFLKEADYDQNMQKN